MKKLAILSVLTATLAVGCLPIKPGRNKHCGYPGMKAHSDICKEGLQCFHDGVCRDPLPEGARCGGTDDCAPGLMCECDDDRCWENPGKCVPRGVAGAGCDSYDDCAAAYFCDVSASTGERNGGTCTERLEQGGACEYDHHCQPALYCEKGACDRRGGPGEACINDTQCFKSFCISGVCEQR